MSNPARRFAALLRNVRPRIWQPITFGKVPSVRHVGHDVRVQPRIKPTKSTASINFRNMQRRRGEKVRPLERPKKEHVGLRNYLVLLAQEINAMDENNNPTHTARKATNIVRRKTRLWFNSYRSARREGRAPEEVRIDHALPAWNLVIKYILHAGHIGVARGIFNDMDAYKMEPNAYTIAIYFCGIAAILRKNNKKMAPRHVYHVISVGRKLNRMIEEQTGDEVSPKIDPVLVSAKMALIFILAFNDRVDHARKMFEDVCPDPRTSPRTPSPYATAAFYTSYLNGLCMATFSGKSDYIYDFWERWETGVRRNMPQVPKFDETSAKTLIWAMKLDEHRVRGAKCLTYFLSQYVGVQFKRSPSIAKLSLENPISLPSKSVCDALEVYRDCEMYAHAADVAEHCGTKELYAIKLALIAYEHLADFKMAEQLGQRDISVANFGRAINACTNAFKLGNDEAFHAGIRLTERCAEIRRSVPHPSVTLLAIAGVEKYGLDYVLSKLQHVRASHMHYVMYSLKAGMAEHNE